MTNAYGKKEKDELYSLALKATLKFEKETLYFDNLIFTSLRSISVLRQIAISSTKYFGWKQGDEVRENNTAVCARKLWCKDWEPDWMVDLDFFARTESPSSKSTFAEKAINSCWFRTTSDQISGPRFCQCVIATASALLVKFWFLPHRYFPIHRSYGWDILVHNFVGSLSLITILRIFIKVWYDESILQYQRPSGPLAKCGEF